jgi:predicted nucleic acid-binding protein
MTVLLDTNVLLRHLLNDHPDYSPRARALFEQIERGERAVHMPDTVIFEAVYTLQRVYHVPRGAIVEAIWPVLQLPHVLVPSKAQYRHVFELYLAHRALSIADCLHAVLALRSEERAILSFDQAISRVPGLAREEP